MPKENYHLRKKDPSRKNRFPVIDGIFGSKNKEYERTRRVIAFPFGLFLGIVFSITFILKLKLNDRTKFIMSGIITMASGIGFAVSRQVRCLAALVIPVFGGKKGRMMIAAYAMSFVIAGPIANIVLNFSNMLSGVGCMTQIQYNLTTEKFKLRFEPIWKMTQQLELIGEKSKEETAEQQEDWEQIKAEVENQSSVQSQMEKTENVDKEVRNKNSRKKEMFQKLDKINSKSYGGGTDRNYTGKNGWRCEDIYNRAMDECVKALDRAYQRCRKQFWLIRGIVCYGFTLVENCNQLSKRKAFQKCTSKKGSTDNFGEAFETENEASNEFKKEFVYSLSARIVPSSENVDDMTPAELMQHLRHEFDHKKLLMAFILSLVNKLISFMFVLVILTARNYLNLYLRNIQFDNIYITDYFRHIDARRTKQGKLTLLPFRKSEEQELCDPRQLKLTSVEKKSIRSASMPFVLQLIAISLIYVFDVLLWNVLDLVRRHGRIDYHQKGVHVVNMTVFGNGFMSDLVRTILHDMSVRNVVDNPISNNGCLPDPHKLRYWNLVTVCLLYVAVFLLTFIEIYSVRLKHAICGFYFPKREKSRIIFLYNARLKMRKNFLKSTIRKIRRRPVRGPPVTEKILVRVERCSPLLSKLLRSTEWWKRRCLLCEDRENKNFGQCQNEECRAVYCPACWKDVQYKCYSCLPDMSDDSDLTDDYLDSN